MQRLRASVQSATVGTTRPQGPTVKESDVPSAPRGRTVESCRISGKRKGAGFPGRALRRGCSPLKKNGTGKGKAALVSRLDLPRLSSPPNYGKNGRAASLPTLGARAKNLSPGSLIAWPGRSVCLPTPGVSCYAPTSADELPNRCEVLRCKFSGVKTPHRSSYSFRISSR